MHEFGLCGVDVGLRRSVIAALEGNRLVYLGEEAVRCVLCGVDAPLTRGRGPFRDCDRQILRMGIGLYPVNMDFMMKLHSNALSLLQKMGCAYGFEVYPYAVRRLLGFGHRKRTAEGRRKIEEALRRFVDMDLRRNMDPDELDAITSALVVGMFLEGRARFVGDECRILLPVSGYSAGCYKIFRP